MDTKLRKQIEWHFRNYEADKQQGIEEVNALSYEGTTHNYGPCPSRSQRIPNPTESKAIRLDKGLQCYLWATVVEYTYAAFRFLPEYDIMVDLYIQDKKIIEIINEYFNKGKWETTFWRWREKWLDIAFKWAREFKLL